MKAASKRGKGKANGNKGQNEADLRAQFAAKGPMRLRKYAISGLNIPAEIADGWNDFDYMVDYCVKKALGKELPEAPPEEPEEDENTFDASDMDYEANAGGGEEDDEESEYDDEMEGEAPQFSNDNDDELEVEAEAEPEPTKPKRTRRRSSPKKKKEEEIANSDDDMTACINQLLDVITNQGVAINNMQQAIARIDSTTKEVFVRQEANHAALGYVGKTVFAMSTILSEFFPRVLKVMNFKLSVTKEIRGKADSAGVDAKELLDSLLDPDAETDVD